LLRIDIVSVALQRWRIDMINPLLGSRALKNEMPKEEKRLEVEICVVRDLHVLFYATNLSKPTPSYEVGLIILVTVRKTSLQSKRARALTIIV
jgi:hypothetical protein